MNLSGTLSGIKNTLANVTPLEKLAAALPDLPFPALESLLADFASAFTQGNRLFTLQIGDGKTYGNRLLPQTLEGREALSECYKYEVTCLSPDAFIPLDGLLGQSVQIDILAGGSASELLGIGGGEQITRCGLITEARALPADGGFAKYQLTIEPPIALLRHRRTSRVFQDISVPKIVQQILDEHIGANTAIAGILKIEPDLTRQYPDRSYCLQYRETDLDFITRILFEEGIAYRFEHELGDVPTVKFITFDDPHGLPQAMQGTVRFHRAAATEAEDSITEWTEARRIGPATASLTSFDYKPVRTNEANQGSKESIQAESSLEDFDAQTLYYGTDTSELYRYAALRQDVHDRQKGGYRAQGNMRGLMAGEWFRLTEHPSLSKLPKEECEFVACVLEFTAQNNLPQNLTKHLTSLVGAAFGGPKTREPGAGADDPPYWARISVRKRGLPLNPAYAHTQHAKPTAPGIQTATVTGPQEEEVHTDEMGRIKVQFHWQRQKEHPEFGANLNERSSCWLRVSYPSAGVGWGTQHIPRIGQEVLIGFIEDDIDRPIVTGAIHNGGQTNPWFSDAGSLPANRTLSGIKSKEFHGNLYNELLFDDTQNQVRAKLSSETGKTQLNQGYLTHPRRDGEAEPRGDGFELRTDCHGALRAGEGLLLSTEARPGAQGKQLDRENALSQLASAQKIAGNHSQAAKDQQADPTEIGPKLLDDEGNPGEDADKGHIDHLVKATQSWESGTNTDTDTGKGTSNNQSGRQPILLASAQDGMGLVTPQEMLLTTGSNLDTVTHRDTQQATVRRWVHNVGKKISLFVQGVADKVNLKLITAKGHANLWAQSGDLEVVGHQDVRLYASKKKHQISACKEILLACGGAYISIKGGKIDIHAPGTISIKSANYNESGPTQKEVQPPRMPQIDIEPFPFKLSLTLKDVPGPDGHALTNIPWQIVKPNVLADFQAGVVDPDDVLVEGKTDDQGKVKLTAEQEKMLGEYYCKRPGCLWISYPGQSVQIEIEPESPDWSDEEKLMKALAALGYSDEAQQAKYLGTSQLDIKRAMKLTGHKRFDDLIGDWEKES